VVPTGSDAEVLPAQEGADIFKLDPNADLVFGSLQAGPQKSIVHQFQSNSLSVYCL